MDELITTFTKLLIYNYCAKNSPCRYVDFIIALNNGHNLFQESQTRSEGILKPFNGR